MFERRRWLSLLFLGGALSGASCAGSPSSDGCHYEGWQGKCKLTDVRTTRSIDRFPKSFVVVEATYDPQMSDGHFSPPQFHKDVLVPAEDEGDATEYLHKYPLVDCAVMNPAGDPCAPKILAQVPDYVPPAVAPVAAGPSGCEKIEHMDSAQIAPAPTTLPGPFQFAESSAAETDDIRRLADAAAAQMKADGRIECVAIKAKTAPGEPFSLANDRAQAVKKLLEARGIDHTRLAVFEATAPSYTASPEEDQPVRTEQQRVYITVVVYDAGKTSP
jgi:hypothetical protein